MKRIVKMLTLVLAMVMVFGCITISTSATSQNDGLSLVKLDTSNYSYEELGPRLIRIISNRADTVTKASTNAPICGADDLDLIFIDPNDAVSGIAPFANPERTAQEEFYLGVRYNGVVIGQLYLEVNGVWSQADGYGRIVNISYDFYNTLYDEIYYQLSVLYESDSTAFIEIFFNGISAGLLEVVQHSNGNITCEIAQN